jgi:hydroxymethylbilane synthase
VRPVRLGTRASDLATTQSGQVGDALGLPYELVHVSTQGDRDRTTPLAQLGGTGVFVSAVRDALLAGEVDLVVHSMKDLPTAAPEGIALGAVPVRADARDALVARDGLTLATLPPGARVGTGSPRRAAQLLAARPDLEVVGIRGNVETRAGKVTSGELDAVVLAAAGLARTRRDGLVSELLATATMLPAPAQGALAVEVRPEDLAGELGAALARIDDPATRRATTAERTLLAVLEAGCSAPVAALATIADGDAQSLTLSARALSLDGTRVVAGTATGTDAEALGRELAADLLARGAGDLLDAARADR